VAYANTLAPPLNAAFPAKKIYKTLFLKILFEIYLRKNDLAFVIYEKKHSYKIKSIR